MHARNRLLRLLALACATITVAGCARGSNGHDSPNSGRTLELVGPPRVDLGEQERHRIEVRYVESGGGRVADAAIDFGIEGDAGGASLAANSARTNDVGVATVELRAGGNATFQVIAQAPDTPALTLEVFVRPRQFGQIEYTVTYDGAESFVELSAARFSNTTCSHLEDRPPAARDVRRPELNRSDVFTEVQVGASHAIYVLGLGPSEQPLAAGCRNLRLESDNATASIALQDMAMGPAEFEVEEVYDLRHGNLVLTVLHFVLGLAGDPAGFLVDFADEAGILGGIASWSVAKSLLASILDDLIGDIVPIDYRRALESIYEDFDSALGNFTLYGELGWDRQPGEDIEREGTHSVDRIMMPMVNDRDIEYRVDEWQRLGITVTPEGATLETHELRIPVGRYVADLLEEQLLPRLPGSPRSMDEVIFRIFDCNEMVRRLGFDQSFAESFAVDLCEAGVGALTDYFESRLTALTSGGRLRTGGSVTFGRMGLDTSPRAIDEGDLDGAWLTREGSELLSFPGDMTGSRLSRDGFTDHPVLERIREFFL